MLRDYIYAIASLISLVAPSLWMYGFYESDIQKSQSINTYAILLATGTLSTCLIADSIGIFLSNKNSKINVANILVMLVFGSLSSVILSFYFKNEQLTLWAILVIINAILISTSEGLAKGAGQYQKFQIYNILAGLIFVVIAVFSYMVIHVSDFRSVIIGRLISAFLAYIAIFKIPKNYSEIKHDLIWKFDISNPFNLMNILAFIYVLLEKVIYGKVSDFYSNEFSITILAAVQVIGLLAGIRGQIISKCIPYINISKKLYIAEINGGMKILLITSPLILLSGSALITKMNIIIELIGLRANTYFLLLLLLISFYIDSKNSGMGVLYTYQNNAKINLYCEIVGVFLILVALVFFGGNIYGLAIIPIIRIVQFIIRRRFINEN